MLVGAEELSSEAAALAEQGQEEEGIAQIRQGLDAAQATGAQIDRQWFLPC